MRRRDLLVSAAALLAFRKGIAQEQHRQPAYLSLQQFILPGNDHFPEEKKAAEIRDALKAAFHSKDLPAGKLMKGVSPHPKSYRPLASDLREAVFDQADTEVVRGWTAWVNSLGSVRRVQFYVLPDQLIRYEVASQLDGKLLYRVGSWRQTWQAGKIVEFHPIEEHLASAAEPWFRDVTGAAFNNLPALKQQLACGIPYWRSTLDPASGIDIYGSNGIAVGDIDNDGVDEIYVCQPGGLPNRLFKWKSDGRLLDITKAWGLDLLDDTSCALFLDLRDSGRQDLVVLRSSGPILFLNEGARYRIQPEAFRFRTLPKGGFTGMAAADFDRDGKLDLYLCCYVYFQSEAQYTYASPYHDAQNGPPNFLFRNALNPDGTGFFEDCTEETGMMENNNRFSFAPAWCDYNGDGWPDLYVANDFGRKNLYRNRNGHFHDVAAKAGVEDIGPGMSASWFDYDGDGKPDLYVANMWTDAGQRVIHDKNFAPAQKAAEAYRAHTMGNSLFHNRGDGTFEDTTAPQNVAFGRWAWSSGGHDFDNDGNPEVAVTCGMLTNTSSTDLNSFFWRQVVAESPITAEPSAEYQNGWNAINQFVREEYSWSGHEPNVFHVRRGERYFDFSGVSGIDFADDSRAFAVCDFDGDGRPDIILKSRLGPQVRVLQNNCTGTNHSIAFQLRGTKSNRDGIGARIQVDQHTKWLEAGSGFLSQHTKTILFGLGAASAANRVQITWPSGLVQEFANLECGKTYQITEGSKEVAGQSFRPRKPLPSTPVAGNNESQLQDTWFLEPVPLPEPQRGPGLFLMKEPREEYQIFRRYLFDWRTSMKLPMALLLNNSGEAIKIYAQTPSAAQVKADLGRSPGLPFDGFYIKSPKRDFFKFGAAFLWAGYSEQALPYLERVLQETPDNARVLVLAGELHLEAGRLDKAEKYFEQASNSESAEAANELGLALAKQGQLDKAQSYFKQAIAKRRDYAEAINNLGVLYTQQAKVNDAVAAFSYGILVSPDEDILYLNLGRLYARTGQLDKARVTMQQLLERKPDSATAKRALQELGN